MGMHHGYLVADLPWPTLSALLQQRAGRFEDRGAIDSIAAVPTQSTDEGWWLAGGEYADRAYVLDYAWQLSGADAPDLVAGLAAESGALVIGCGAETVSGSYYLVAARGRQVLRHFYACHWNLSAPYSTGEPFPTEAAQPFEGDLSGDALYAVLGYLGFDPISWQEGHYDATHPGYRRLVLFPDDATQADASPRGPLAEALAEHTRQFGRPPERRPKPRVVATSGAPRGHRAPAVGSGWLERLGRWLHGG